MKQDHEAVKTLAIAIGVRPAARRLGLNEDTVCAWAKREAWFSPTPRPPSQAIDVQALQAKPSQALADTLLSDSAETKIGFSRAARKVAEHAANLKPQGIYKRARAIKDIAAVAGQVHGWQEKGKEQTNVLVNVAILGVDPAKASVSATTSGHSNDVIDAE